MLVQNEGMSLLHLVRQLQANLRSGMPVSALKFAPRGVPPSKGEY
jgi:hypothetical protein